MGCVSKRHVPRLMPLSFKPITAPSTNPAHLVCGSLLPAQRATSSSSRVSLTEKTPLLAAGLRQQRKTEGLSHIGES